MLVQFPRPALGELENAREMGVEARRKHVDSLKREATSTRSALKAQGVVLRDVVAFYKVFNGFAATVRTRDLPKLNSNNLRVRTVRRAYPASSEPVPVHREAAARAGGAGRAAADRRARHRRRLRARSTATRTRATTPSTATASPRRARTPAAATARRRAGPRSPASSPPPNERVMPIRVASLRAAGGAAQTEATTDQIIAGLEHAVDPNGDLDTSDHVPVALVGVNAPYAGFSRTPEAQAIEGAAGLGTLTIAPAGNEGAAAPGSGTVGSPASAPEALAVGALTGPEPAPRTELDAGGAKVDAAVLAGTPPKAGKTAGPVEDTDPAVLGEAATRIRGKVVIVRAGANPAAQAAAAAAVGAAAVLIAQPEDTPLPSLPAGRSAAPVIGVTGEAAKDVLELEPGTSVSFGAPERGPKGETAAGAQRVHVHRPGPVRRRPPEARPRGGRQRADDLRRHRRDGRRGGARRRRGRQARPRPPGALPAAAPRHADRRRPAARPPGRPRRRGPRQPRPPAASPPTRRPPARTRSTRSRSTSTPPSRRQVTLRATGGATATPNTATLVPGTPTDRHRPPAQARHDHRPAGSARRQPGHRERPVAHPPGRGRADRGRRAEDRPGRPPRALHARRLQTRRRDPGPGRPEAHPGPRRQPRQGPAHAHLPGRRAAS